MRSEKPYTKSKNALYIGKNKGYSNKKKKSQNLNSTRGMTFQRSKLQKASFKKTVFKVFLL